MKRFLILVAILWATGQAWAGLDHDYAKWDGLLKKHVRWLPDQKQSRVDYAALKADRAALKAVLDELSAVTRAEFDAYNKAQRMAFLINAYNAFTVELILTKYPDLKSIRNLGTFFKTPWRNDFFTLFGDKRHLDWIEHAQLRKHYDEPRIHAAINCAAIGCPALRDEAFTATKLEAQLADSMQRFMSDRTRNRVRNGNLEVSSIFQWFREDFEKGHAGFSKLEDVFAAFATQLTDKPEEQQALRAKTMPVSHLDYDWSLNVVGK